MPRETQQNKDDLSRRTLFGVGGSVLLGAVAMPGVAEAEGNQGAGPSGDCVFDLQHMPADPESGPGGTVQMARQKQFPFMTGATVARLIMEPGCSRSPHWHLNSWEVQFCISGSCKLSTVDEHGNLFEDI